MTTAETLGTFAAGLKTSGIPGDVVEKARSCILDSVGVTLSGSRTPVGEAARRYGAATGHAGPVRVVPTGERDSLEQAAFTMGVYAFSQNFADSTLKSVAHCGSVVVPAILAVLQGAPAAGEDVLAAIVAGYEVMELIARSLNGGATRMSHQLRGFRPTATCGAFGAAAAAARLLRLSAAETSNALMLAANLACGLRWVSPSPLPAIRFQSGTATQAGITAVLLTQAGVAGYPSVLEREGGFVDAFGGDARFLTELAAGVGEAFLIRDVVVKLHCTPHTLAPALDGILLLMSRHGFGAADVAEVAVRVPQAHHVVSGLSSTFAHPGYPHAIAVALTTGHPVWPGDVASFADDPEVGALADRIHVEPDAELEAVFGQVDCWPAEVSVRLRSGAEHTERVMRPKGDRLNPCSQEELASKFRQLGEPVLGPERIERFEGLLSDLERLADAGEMVRCLLGAG